MTHVPDHAIAITGLAARLPGAPDVETFWQNLLGGRESITFFDRDELLRAGVPAAQLDDARYVRARGTIEGIDLFDAQFFGVTPREAEMMDPQHRLFLECAWHALENAGCDPSRFDGMIGVYASAGLNTYLINNVSRNPEVLEAAGSFQAFVGNDKDFLPMRVSYKLGLRGPSIGVQTACSSSLVAAALACQALLTYQCDAALVGAANVAVPQLSGYVHHEGGSFSPDGRCRPFDASAAGTVFSNGAGAIVLRRLADAIAGGDTIHAIITGFAVNNDGSAKIGFTAPSVEGQAEAVTLALELAGRHPEDLGYIEAHGTGTILGDPIEIAALTQVFRAYTARRGFCAIGSVKSNIGHLDVAAGLAGLIKATLAVERGVIPPSLHFERPNPRIDFASTPFFVNTAVRPWTGEPRRAGVTSLGLGGTNAHLVIEQAPPREIEPTRRRRHILPLSARGETPLADARKALAAALREGGIDLADAAFTLQIGRKAFELRQYVLAGDPSEAADALERRGGAPVRAASPRLALLFPGQEAQYAGLGRELANEEPLFRE
ncbi:MAG TPA: type I polyketide synthase, partial [Thermoanaerobaculia bacterium]|nr:type I polyketide synthase [Thermoanaerobaculia bacterium]